MSMWLCEESIDSTTSHMPFGASPPGTPFAVAAGGLYAPPSGIVLSVAPVCGSVSPSDVEATEWRGFQSLVGTPMGRRRSPLSVLESPTDRTWELCGDRAS